jgi:ADP-heptose:LPS heptosyltransferase
MNVLFVRTDGIGDLILTLPAATALKRQRPDVRLSYLVSRYAAPVLEHHPDVDEILCDPGLEDRSARRRFLGQGFDAVVFFKPYRNWFWSAYRAGIRRRIGTGYRWYSFLLSDRVYEHRSRFNKHESEYNLNLLKPLNVTVSDPKPPKLYLTPFEINQADEILTSLTRPRVIVHPGNIYARNWTSGRYFDLIRELRTHGFSVALTGSEQEWKNFNSRERGSYLANSGVTNLMGRLNLRQFIAVVSQCDLVVSGSTGPMHMAAALGVPTVSLFDPRRGSSTVRWGPLGGRGVVFKPEVPICEKCIYEKCPYWDCMDRIPVETVAQKVQEVLSQHQAVRAGK